MSSWDSKGPILAFFCNWAPYKSYMDLGEAGLCLSSHIHPIKVMCAGRVDPPMLLSAFEKGAEGVVVIGCKDKECRYGPGPEQEKKLAERMKALMQVLGLEDERFSTMAYASHEKDRLFAEMNAFAEKIAQIKKSPLAR